MIYNPFYCFVPFVPDEKFQRPPLLYDLMNSIVNFDSETHTRISDLSNVARETIFDFDYPLSENVDKEKFETLILDRFLMRRLAYETYTAWHIALRVKINEIMPYYNKLFDAMSEWNLFKDGESGTREKEIGAKSETDSRYSKLPQNEIQDIKDGSYMTDYTLGQNESSGNEKENYSKDNSNKIDTYTRYLQENTKIMNLIYKDLDSLFYGLAN